MLDLLFVFIATLFLAWGMGLEVLFLMTDKRGVFRWVIQLEALCAIYAGLIFVVVAAT